MYLLKVRKRFLLAHTFFSLMVGVGGAALFHAFFPQWYFSAYPLIPVFFYLFGCFYIFMFEFVYRRMPDKMIIVYLIAKFLKMMLSIQQKNLVMRK